ncbi:MAG: glycosyltransferase family 39 protein [Anaerolineales bacterium]|nr:glycosyltransferase family 39 protein [Anaerolineales bacterium]
MQEQKRIFGLSSINFVIFLAALVKFAIHLYSAPGYGFFGDEFYTIALSRHLAFGYVDLPPLVPALMALSRAILGESLFAMHIVPALAGAGTLVFICMITKEFGGKTFAVTLAALGFIVVPIWLSVDSVFCYDSIDQLILSVFLYTLVRFLRTGNRKLWILLGMIAGIACMTKMTILFLGPGFLVALLASKYRKDLLTPWPWLGAALCAIIVSPYLLWQYANDWPTLEYWTNYGTHRVYQASLPQYLVNVLVYMHTLLLPLWLAGLYRIFRRLDGVDYSFLGVFFVGALGTLFTIHASARMLAEVFMPLLAAGAVFIEELSDRAQWRKWMRVSVTMYLLAAGAVSIPLCLPILPVEQLLSFSDSFKSMIPPVKEFNGQTFRVSPAIFGRLGWDEMIRDVADVYNELPQEERAVAGIYAEWYMPAGAIDHLGPQYGLPHAVSGSLTYYLWGPGYSWDTMIIVAGKINYLDLFFKECEMKREVQYKYDMSFGKLYIHVCRKPVIPPDRIWPTMKSYR